MTRVCTNAPTLNIPTRKRISAHDALDRSNTCFGKHDWHRTVDTITLKADWYCRFRYGLMRFEGNVGSGESTLVNDLLARGYSDLTILDISQVAIAASRERSTDLVGGGRFWHWGKRTENQGEQAQPVRQRHCLPNWLTMPSFRNR